MAPICLNDVLKAPEALRQALEERSNKKAKEFANALLDGLSSRSGLSSEDVKQSVEEIAGANEGSNWGSKGW